MKKIVATVLLLTSTVTQAQYSAVSSCGDVSGQQPQNQARIYVFHDRNTKPEPDSALSIEACAMRDDGTRISCDRVFGTTSSDLISVQWKGQNRLTIETVALREAGQQLELRLGPADIGLNVTEVIRSSESDEQDEATRGERLDFDLAKCGAGPVIVTVSQPPESRD